LGWDVPDSEADLLVASAWRGIYWNGGATSAKATVVFSIVSVSKLADKNEEKKGEEWWRRERVEVEKD
jgi:hypothetical protein